MDVYFEEGFDPSLWPKLFYSGLTSQTTLTVLSVFAVLVIYDILRWGWIKSFTDRMVSGSLASIAIFISNILFVPFTYYSVEALQYGYDALSVPHIPETFWSPLPFWIAGILAIFAHDFADYWNHRLMHTKWVWPVHAIHHSDQEVNALTTFRVHFLEVVIMRGSYILMLSWLGFSPEAAGFGAVLLTIHNAYVHADLDWDHGPFKFLVASPKFHRWHHANEPEAFGKNLANVVPAYDYMFGTYYDPGYVAKCEMGADGVPHADVIALMAFPFKEWTKAIRAKLNKQNAEIGERRIVEPAE